MPSQQIDYLLSTRAHPGVDSDEIAPPEASRIDDPWRGCDVWAFASGRLDDYSPEQWAEIAAGQRDWERQLIALVTAGAAADGGAAIALAEEHRRWVERWHFTCPPQLHREIVDALLGDASFRLRYDGLATGAAQFLQGAVRANADRADS